MTMTEEGKAQAKKIKELEDQDYNVIKLRLTNKNGIPDLLAIPRDCPVLFTEMKSKTGKASPLQKYRIKELKSWGFKAEICD